MAEAYDPARADRNRDIINDRINGLTYRQLGAKYEISHTAAHEIVRGYTDNAIKPAAEELVQLEIDRHERLLNALEPKIEAGDVKAIEAAVKVSMSYRKLIGVDAATKVEVEHTATAAVTELQERLNKALQSHVDETE